MRRSRGHGGGGGGGAGGGGVVAASLAALLCCLMALAGTAAAQKPRLPSAYKTLSGVCETALSPRNWKFLRKS
uniref:Uncharacterized protein n=1 Tax=Arundo donax TaxID=35708 RepID=A0A0A9DF33_ARUDO